jgi:hypothetical protein
MSAIEYNSPSVGDRSVEASSCEDETQEVEETQEQVY